MTVFVVRHADAVSRHTWPGADTDRPLTARGERQANGIVTRLAASDVADLLSSPARRCIETLQPLAAARGIPVTPTEVLREGAPIASAWDLLVRAAGAPRDTVLCAHGDLIPDLLDLAVRTGAASDPLQWPKASTWRLDWDGERFRSVRYLPPPA